MKKKQRLGQSQSYIRSYKNSVLKLLNLDEKDDILCLDLGSRQGVPTLHLEKHNLMRFISNAGPDPLENHKATKPALRVGQLSARHLSGVLLGVNDGPLIVV